MDWGRAAADSGHRISTDAFARCGRGARPLVAPRLAHRARRNRESARAFWQCLARHGGRAAGGVGITPFIATLRAASRAQPTTLIYLFRQSAVAAFLEELKRYPQRPLPNRATA